MCPDFISHYYLADRPPFLSLSDLGNDTENPVFTEMLNRYKWDEKYNRRFGADYLNTRITVENELRELFILRGGQPRRQFPIYFVLGESNWFRCLNKDHKEIRIPIDALDARSVSVTFPDSYITMTKPAKPYYRKVHFISEIRELLEEYGLPEDKVPGSYENYWEGDFELYYEVQVWDDQVLQLYTDSSD